MALNFLTYLPTIKSTVPRKVRYDGSYCKLPTVFSVFRDNHAIAPTTEGSYVIDSLFDFRTIMGVCTEVRTSYVIRTSPLI